MDNNQAILIRINEFTAGDFSMSEDEFNRLLKIQRDKTPVTILGVGCEVTGEFEDDYHDIQLSDGTTYDAISGYNLELIS